MKLPTLRLAVAQLVLLTGCAAGPLSTPLDSGALERLAIATGDDDDDEDEDDDDDRPTTPGNPTGAGSIVGQPLRTLTAAPDADGNPTNGITTINLTVSEEDIQILNGPKTRMLVFNKQFPGPTIKANIGDRVRVNVTNNYSAAVSVHFHGLVIEPEHDGGPWNQISPGQSHTYTWIAKTEYPLHGWYHAHAHGVTHIQAPRGMLGGMEILDPNDPVPKEYSDEYVILSDNKFTLDNQLPNDTEFDRWNGREGDHVFANGQEKPVLKLKPGEIRRMCFLNAGPARYYNLAAPGLTMHQIGTDGGLIERPYKLDKVLLAVAERADLLIQAPTTPGTYQIKSLPYDRGLGLRENFSRDLITIEVEPGPVAVQPPMPTFLRSIPPLDLTKAKKRFFELGKESVGGGMHHFTINEKRFDPIRIDNVATLGDVEIFEIDNKSGNWDHPMHLHSVQFQILDIDGEAPPFRAWKDVMNLPRSTRGRFAVRFAENEFPGIFMFHCHILQHEDDGMMTHIMVNPKITP